MAITSGAASPEFRKNLAPTVSPFRGLADPARLSILQPGLIQSLGDHEGVHVVVV
ncbi:hypothetical protein [Streptomyces tauricus]|uniref:hypothetical protein n=1 Tax=Streptomyces tauricus TaxID=68274 RepID=UPI003436806F